MPSLAALDVNLLVALDALLQTRSVTAAARRMAVSQPAMSQTLARLRTQLDDPLLVRVGAQMVPTPRAEALAGPLRAALAALQAAVSAAPTFEPATATRTFTLATTDYGAALWVPEVTAHLARVAPGVNLRVVPQPADVTQGLQRGAFDVVVGVLPDLGAGVRRQVLYRDGFQGFVRAGHPLLAAPDRLAAYCAAGHVLVGLTGTGDGAVDRALAAQGLSRRVVVRVPFFLAAPLVALRSDLVLTSPARAVAAFTGWYPAVAFEPPVDLPQFTISLAWHLRDDADPGARWLRAQIQQIVK